MAKKTTKISTGEGIRFGVMLLGQVSGILIGTALAGFLADLALGTHPLGLAGGVLVGSIWATITVLLKVKNEVS